MAHKTHTFFKHDGSEQCIFICSFSCPATGQCFGAYDKPRFFIFPVRRHFISIKECDFNVFRLKCSFTQSSQMKTEQSKQRCEAICSLVHIPQTRLEPPIFNRYISDAISLVLSICNVK